MFAGAEQLASPFQAGSISILKTCLICVQLCAFLLVPMEVHAGLVLLRKVCMKGRKCSLVFCNSLF